MFDALFQELAVPDEERSAEFMYIYAAQSPGDNVGLPPKLLLHRHLYGLYYTFLSVYCTCVVVSSFWSHVFWPRFE